MEDTERERVKVRVGKKKDELREDGRGVCQGNSSRSGDVRRYSARVNISFAVKW